ncbi:MAG: hypothetical protein IJO43_00215 [Bacilli bacterium]|nr:hypothetical protein [Bacilli bacterium]
MNKYALHYFKKLLVKKQKIDSLEQQLLNTLMYRAENNLSSINQDNNGVLTTKFYLSPFDGAVDEGYVQIQELIKLQAFDSFAQKYHLSLVDSRDIEGARDRYYEISWDYQKTMGISPRVSNQKTKVYCYSN